MSSGGLGDGSRNSTYQRSPHSAKNGVRPMYGRACASLTLPNHCAPRRS
jgi:hypothetical protein